MIIAEQGLWHHVIFQNRLQRFAAVGVSRMWGIKRRQDPPDQIPQQHRRAGSSSHQAIGPTDAGVQVLLVSRGDAGRHRTDAHDPERPIADNGRNVSGPAILFVGGIKPVISTGAVCPTRKLATEPTIAAHDDKIEVVIPPRSTAVPGGEPGPPTQRDRHLAMIAEQGRLAWQNATNYGRRSLVETTMSRYESLLGPRLRARGFAAQQSEAAIGVEGRWCSDRRGVAEGRQYD
jgi:hypothetical protein